MLHKPLLFISFNKNIAYIYNPNNNITNKLPLNFLNNLVAKHDLVVCNKQLLKRIIPDNIINNIKDILNLYAIVFPTKFTSDNINSIAKAINIPYRDDLSSQASTLYDIYKVLITSLKGFNYQKQSYILIINDFMSQNIVWEWFFIIKDTLKNVKIQNSHTIKVWKNLLSVETSVTNNTKININKNLERDLIIDSLNNLTQKFGGIRNGQQDYAITVSKIFSNNKVIINPLTECKEEIIKPNIVFAEAGTGVGKTVGYLSAVFAFIKKNPNSSVIISTYSKALQQQILNEVKANVTDINLSDKVVVIKGNQNYICLLNIEYIFNDIYKYENGNLFLGYILRWLQETNTGDLLGGDFLHWLNNITPGSNNIINNILNKKEECLYSKCNYYKKCFITKVKEKAKKSNIIISNHSLTLLNNYNSKYIIFDEAHNLYNVSDEVFSKEVSAAKGIFLKNWLLGNNLNRYIKSNPLLNGFSSRVLNMLFNVNKNNETNKNFENTLSSDFIPEKEIITDDYNEEEIIDLKIKTLLKTLNYCSSFLPTNSYLNNIEKHNPQGVFEEFLYYIYLHVLLHNNDLEQYYSQESYIKNLGIELEDTAVKLLYQLTAMLKVANNLKEEFTNKLEITRKENKHILTELINSFDINCISIIKDFIELLQELNNTQESYIYRFSIIKDEGRIENIGYFKNHINPLKEFSKKIISNKYGIAFTSATLFDSDSEVINEEQIFSKFEISENNVEVVGNIKLNSPFNYVNNSKIIILNTDYSKNDAKKHEALLQLFLAAKGGVLALFTSIARLKQHYNYLAKNYFLKEKCIDILAPCKHNKLSNSIIDMFKENKNSCLLGSDSFRDGIDIPGCSLRMVIFEKVPWLRKSILNEVRKKYYNSNLEEENVRFKLRQAFGRLIRSNTDKGIFVMLNPQFPTRLLSAFPENIEVHKITLEEAIKLSETFLDNYEN